MCGLTGSWTYSGLAPVGLVQEMTDLLEHRGPNSKGVWSSPSHSIALGHTRLSILDLSSQGHQPMQSRSGRLVMVFNGEIYNHLEIRERLGATVQWRGNSDTETLLECADKWGLPRALQASTGMFSLALWDQDTRQLVLARDRMGEKPLYYAFTSEGLIFGSELKALKACPSFNGKLSDRAVNSFLNFGFVSGEDTIYDSVKKVPPGQLITINEPSRIAETASYWSLPSFTDASDNDGKPEGTLEELEFLLRRSIKQQLISDVPLGAFLSGGIDSSLIVGLMQQESSQPVRTFSIGMANDNDESKHASKVAAHFGCDHTTLVVTPDDALNVMPKLTEIYDEPFADSSQIPTILLSKLTSQKVTVALSGDGGDELFGGYNRYLAAKKLSPYIDSIPQGLRARIANILQVMPATLLSSLFQSILVRKFIKEPIALDEKIARVASFLAQPTVRDAYLSSLSQWTGNYYSHFISEDVMPRLLRQDLSWAQQMMSWDQQYYLPDDILTKVDRASMASSLEVRVPFLDHRIVEFAASLPLEHKIHGGQTKWPLRKLLQRQLPEHLYARPKQGFTLPIDSWLRTDLREWAEELLSEESLKNCEFLEVSVVRKAWGEHLAGRANHQRGLWTILTLLTWLRGA